jgi:hypothetical protein
VNQKYLYKRTLIVTVVTAIAHNPVRGIFQFDFNIVGHIPTEKHLKRIGEQKAPDGTTISSIAKIQTKRKLFGITPDAFIDAADELDPSTGKIIEKRGI